MLELVPLRRRRSIRHSIHLRCQAVELSRFHEVGHFLLDVSPRGALIACDDEVALGDSLILTFQVPEGPEEGTWVDAEAEVVRVIEGRRTCDAGYAAGVRFTSIDGRGRRAIREGLSHVPEAWPARPEPLDYASTVRRIGLSRRC